MSLTGLKRVLVCGSVLTAAIAAAALVAPAATAQVPAEGGAARPTPRRAINAAIRPLYHRVPLKSETSTLYFDGSEIECEVFERWNFMCGSDTADRTIDDLKRIADNHHAEEAANPGGVRVVDRGGVRTNINIIYNIQASVPDEWDAAFALAEAYIESKFADPINVSLSVSAADLGGGVLGATSVNQTSTTYTNSRNGLVNGKDTDDTIQDWLPTGSTVPVRYDGNSATVSNENNTFWSIANYRATVGSINGSAGSIQFNTNFNWDLDPSNGVSGYSMVDVIIHETGHALGFISYADDFVSDLAAPDLFRFQRSDGTGTDYNPDTLGEFQTTARMIDYNAPGTNDDVNIDLITVEHRMSDGDPYQASHFREGIGAIMDPALANGQTYYPNYLRTPDMDVFDAIGFDVSGSACDAPVFDSQPASQNACTGENVNFSVVVNAAYLPATYQWRIGTTNLSDGASYSGVTTATLTVLAVDAGDAVSNYNCLVTRSCGTALATSNASLTVSMGPTITQQPQNRTRSVGESVTFSVSATGGGLAYQWRHDGVDLGIEDPNNPPTLATLIINDLELSDAGLYDCRVTDTFTGCSTMSTAATLTVTNPQLCPGDATGDKLVNNADLQAVLDAWASTTGSPNYNPDADFDGNGSVGNEDLQAVLDHWAVVCP